MIFFDGHVHIYDCYDMDKFFTEAFKNFSFAGAKLQSGPSCSYFLLLAESRGCNYFHTLQQRAKNGGDYASSPWRVEESGEACSLYVFHDAFPSMRLVVAAGRQLITKEKLELLALMTATAFSDGMPLQKGVDEVIQAGGIAVCPWGAGKWLGGRGQVLTTYMNSGSAELYLGDSGGRPSLWPFPALFKGEYVADTLLSGSDPLPLAGEEGRVGQFGTYVDCDSPKESPVAFLKNQLKTKVVELKGYGKPCSSLTFCKNQVALRLKKKDK